MKVAIPHWQGRVSPVFDVAGHVWLVEVDGGVEQTRREVSFDTEGLQARARRLVEAGADVLVCGAISRPLERAVTAAGVEVVAQTCGDVESVLAAYIDGRLGQGAFLMPGCRRRGNGRMSGRRRQRHAGGPPRRIRRGRRR
ncbi:MAG: dinitrogenase iron-molybdenum cofactor biosynthesis protein [Phycisphaerae bacterium]|nr:dinitrogenase iron-molybdenum cofactor biosynthesis protein [Phycisphaerae bacterium]